MRNMVEVGGLNISLSNTLDTAATATAAAAANATAVPLTASSSFFPKSLSILPKLTGQVIGPFLMVLGSEMVVDWIKHAYVDKFNDTKPTIYSRFLDVMAADYYSNAFGDQNLTKRIGLPVLPLACLFVRTTVQTYHMFLATHLPLPLPSAATSLVNAHDTPGEPSPNATSTPGTVAALAHVDLLFRRALGRFDFPSDVPPASTSWIARILALSIDDAIAFALLVLICAVVFLALVAAKLVLGMVLLQWSRARCLAPRERDGKSGESVSMGTRRLGINGMVEVPEESRRRIYEGDEVGLAKMREKEDRGRREREKERDRSRGVDFGRVERYAMVAKRIW
jgi:hypothetical protein